MAEANENQDTTAGDAANDRMTNEDIDNALGISPAPQVIDDEPAPAPADTTAGTEGDDSVAGEGKGEEAGDDKGKGKEKEQTKPAAETTTTAAATTTTQTTETKAEALEDPAIKARADRLAAVQKDIDEYQAEAAKRDLDPIDDKALINKGLKALAAKDKLRDEELNELRQQTVGKQQEEDAFVAYFEKWGDDNKDIGADKGIEIWEEEVKAAKAEFGDDQKVVRAVATRAFRQQVEAIREKAKADAEPAEETEEQVEAPKPRKEEKKPVKAPPVNKGAAKVIPSGNQLRPNPTPATLEDQIRAGKFDFSDVMKV